MEDGKLFHPNQEITPIDNGGWHDRDTGALLECMPRFGEIYHVKEYKYFMDGLWWITLKEFPLTNLFNERSFAPVLGDETIAELVEEAVMV